MRIFAPDAVAAKSRFWYFMKKLRKLKKSVGEVVLCSEVNPSSLSCLVIVVVAVVTTCCSEILDTSENIYHIDNEM